MLAIRVRYAPSPTGVPHIGNIRTALYNYLFAKKSAGQFILRIEDTDRNRLIPESLAKIKQSLKLLNLSWDEEYQQSTRLEIYKTHLENFKKRGIVYEDKNAWFFKVKSSKNISWQDVVHGYVQFSTDVIEDFVIVKSDGFPTYHFAATVDDHDMQISHVIRGDEWISSTPKHLLLYEAFGWDPPQFVHLPPILGPDKKKLSKREGAKSVIEYIDDGYLPEALVNFLALLGWAPLPSEALSEGGKREKELYSLGELIKIFSLERLNKNSPIFNLEKLNWFNNQWIKKLEDKDLAQRISQRSPQFPSEKILPLVPLVKERIKTLADFEELTGFFFSAPDIKKISKVPVTSEVVSQLISGFKNTKVWTAKVIKETIEEVAEKSKEDRVKTIMSVRNIVSGREVTPPLYESLEILGLEETVKRLEDYLQR